MNQKNIFKLKSNKGFTMQDLIIAITIFSIFTGLICTLIVNIFIMQAESNAQEVATLYAVQIVEYIDKIAFEDVTENLSTEVVEMFNIPSGFNIDIKVTEYKTSTKSTKESGLKTQANFEEAEIRTDEYGVYTKMVSTNISYTLNKEEKNILINRLKIREM